MFSLRETQQLLLLVVAVVVNGSSATPRYGGDNDYCGDGLYSLGEIPVDCTVNGDSKSTCVFGQSCLCSKGFVCGESLFGGMCGQGEVCTPVETACSGSNDDDAALDAYIQEAYSSPAGETCASVAAEGACEDPSVMAFCSCACGTDCCEPELEPEDVCDGKKKKECKKAKRVGCQWKKRKCSVKPLPTAESCSLLKKKKCMKAGCTFGKVGGKKTCSAPSAFFAIAQSAPDREESATNERSLTAAVAVVAVAAVAVFAAVGIAFYAYATKKSATVLDIVVECTSDNIEMTAQEQE